MKIRIVVWLKSGEYVKSKTDKSASKELMSYRADSLRDAWDKMYALTIEREEGDIVLIPKENIETITFEKEE